jgi:hypothetical protein
MLRAEAAGTEASATARRSIRPEMHGQRDLTLVRYFASDRYVLQSVDGHELAVLPHGLPGEALIEGRAVRLIAKRRKRRIAVEAVDGDAVVGWIELSWVPGVHRIRVGDSEFRVTRGWLGHGWHLSRERVRVATLKLNAWFSSGVNLIGDHQGDAGGVVLIGQPFNGQRYSAGAGSPTRNARVREHRSSGRLA